MENTKPDQKVEHKEEKSLIGTALGVGLVGVVILISYITLYALYMIRV